MSKQTAFANYFNFNGGIQTDMSPLNIKPNEAIDMENIYIKSDGGIRRFKGVDLLSVNDIFDKPVNSSLDMFYWETYNKNKLFRSYVCVLTRQFVRLYTLDLVNQASIKLETEYVFEKELSENFGYDVDGVRLVIASANEYPFYLYLDEEDKLKKEVLPIFVRDLTFNPVEHDYIVDELNIGIEDGNAWEPKKIHGITIDNEPLHYYDDIVLKVFKEGEYPDSVACFSGRVFLGCNGRNNSTVYFSQVLQGAESMPPDLEDAYATFGFDEIEPTTSDYTMFFTANPSWSLRDPAVVADDGGYVAITGVNEIRTLVGYRDSVFVFAKNGVWRLFGRDEIFAANDYSVEKLSDAGLVSKKAYCVIDNLPAYASDNGIYVIMPDQVSGQLVSYSITDNKIDNLYNKIPLRSREKSKLYYERTNKLLYYLYNSSPDRVLNDNSRYGDVLIFNTKLKAWFKRTFSKEVKPNYRISNMFFMPAFEASYEGEEIDTYRTFIGLDNGSGKFTFGKFEGDTLYDFNSLGEEGREYYKSYLVSAHQLFEDIGRIKQLPYIHILFKRTETGIRNDLGIDENSSDATLRTSLGFTSTPYLVNDEFGELYLRNAQYGKERYIYPRKRPKFDMYRDYLLYAHRLLGRGKSLQFHISSRRDEYSFMCICDNVKTSPLLDKDSWLEIDYSNEYPEWNKNNKYNKNDRVKVNIEYDFEVVGWACELLSNTKGSATI